MPTSRRNEGAMEFVPPQVEQARRTLWTGLLVFRWAFYAWMVVAAGVLLVKFDRSVASDALAFGGVIGVGLWNVWLTLDDHQERTETPYVDLVIAIALILASSFVVPRGEIIGTAPFYAVAYPSNAALLWGATKGPGGGLFAGAVLSAALVLGRLLNAVDLTDDFDRIFSLVNGSVYYLAAGAATGVFSLLFTRWAAEFRSLAEESLRARERAARLAERESIARRLHDSVLAALNLIMLRGTRLVQGTSISAGDVGDLVGIAREQERALRGFVAGQPEEVPEGKVSLGDRLELIAAHVVDPKVVVNSVGEIWLNHNVADEIAAAVQQALDNAVRHSGATRVNIFLDAVDDGILVSVRDDGVGFVYDEAALAAADKLGVLKSMKGRIADLGGSMTIESAPGLGTEIEFRVPLRPAAEGEGDR
jgi:signal transduction histidine kinase